MNKTGRTNERTERSRNLLEGLDLSLSVTSLHQSMLGLKSAFRVEPLAQDMCGKEQQGVLSAREIRRHGL